MMWVLVLVLVLLGWGGGVVNMVRATVDCSPV